jgi:hypothetical protein
MGMGNFACDGFTISYDNIKKMCPAEIEAIENGPHWKYLGWGELAKGIDFQDEETIADVFLDAEDEDCVSEEQSKEFAKEYVKLVKQLEEAFEKKTDGLTLFLSHYNEDEGDRYDSVDHKDGCIFMVDGMVDYTPAGEKHKDIVKKNRWVQFG